MEDDRNMLKIEVKYTIIICSVLFGFANFIACGSQFYQMSLEGDVEPMANSEATNPASPSYGIHAVNGWNTLPIHFKVGHHMNLQQYKGLKSAMETWEMVIGKPLFVYEGIHENTTGDSFKDLYSSLNDPINGHYLDDYWGKTEKENHVLATTIWHYSSRNSGAISKADIRFNNEFFVIGDSLKLKPQENREVVDMETLALHELGHLLGLAHVGDKEDPGSIMVPRLLIGEGLTKRRISEGDILRIQQIYGCYGDACDVEELVKTIEYRQNKGNSSDSNNEEIESESKVLDQANLAH